MHGQRPRCGRREEAARHLIPEGKAFLREGHCQPAAPRDAVAAAVQEAADPRHGLAERYDGASRVEQP